MESHKSVNVDRTFGSKFLKASIGFSVNRKRKFPSLTYFLKLVDGTLFQLGFHAYKNEWEGFNQERDFHVHNKYVLWL